MRGMWLEARVARTSLMVRSIPLHSLISIQVRVTDPDGKTRGSVDRVWDVGSMRYLA